MKSVSGELDYYATRYTWCVGEPELSDTDLYYRSCEVGGVI